MCRKRRSQHRRLHLTLQKTVAARIIRLIPVLGIGRRRTKRRRSARRRVAPARAGAGAGALRRRGRQGMGRWFGPGHRCAGIRRRGRRSASLGCPVMSRSTRQMLSDLAGGSGRGVFRPVAISGGTGGKDVSHAPAGGRLVVSLHGNHRRRSARGRRTVAHPTAGSAGMTRRLWTMKSSTRRPC